MDVTVHLTPNSFVRKVSVEGNVYFREREIRKRIFLRPGSVLNATPGRERADETVQRQVDSLKRLIHILIRTQHFGYSQHLRISI